MSTLGFGSDDFVNKFINTPIKKKTPIMNPKALKAEVEDIEICEECGSDQLIRNPDGYMVCSDCGMTKEGIYFVNYNRMVIEDKSRIISANPIYGTMIGEKSERKGKFERLSVKNDRETQNYKVKIRKAAYFEMQYIFGALNIPMTFLDEALNVFIKNWESFKKNSWLRNINGGCAAAAYLIAKQRHFIIDFKSFKQILRCDSKIFTKIILNLGLKCDGLKNTKNAIVKRLIMDESKIANLDFQVRRLACYLVDKYPLELLNTNENIAAVSSISAALHLINGKRGARTIELSQAFEVATSCITTRINKLFAKIVPNFRSISKSKTEELKIAGLKILKASGIISKAKANTPDESHENDQINASELEKIEAPIVCKEIETTYESIEHSSSIRFVVEKPQEIVETASNLCDQKLFFTESLNTGLKQEMFNPSIKQSEGIQALGIDPLIKISKTNTLVGLKQQRTNYNHYYHYIGWEVYDRKIKGRKSEKTLISKQTLHNNYRFTGFSNTIFRHLIVSYFGNLNHNSITLSLINSESKTNQYAIKNKPGWFEYGKDPPWDFIFYNSFKDFSNFLYANLNLDNLTQITNTPHTYG